jgi:hypothetical protein
MGGPAAAVGDDSRRAFHSGHEIRGGHFRHQDVTGEDLIYVGGVENDLDRTGSQAEDGVLIVETSNFTENPIGVTDGLPSSNEKHLLERFARDADGQSLIYTFELTDPVYLAEPLIGEMRWLYRPNVDFELVPCDPDATRSFLDN